MLKYIPDTIGVLRGKGLTIVPVTNTVSYPPGSHPPECPIVSHMIAVQVKTDYGCRWFGTDKAYIDSFGRFVIDVNKRDEVLSKWEDTKGLPDVAR